MAAKSPKYGDAKFDVGSCTARTTLAREDSALGDGLPLLRSIPEAHSQNPADREAGSFGKWI